MNGSYPRKRIVQALLLAITGGSMLVACGGGDGDAPIVATEKDAVMAAIQAMPSAKEVAFITPEGPAVCPTTSHPFSTMLCSRGLDLTGSQPIDLKNDYGYVEKEFFLSGKANVYDLGSDERAVVKSSGHDYTTRLLVRYPDDPAKFNGRVFIDILNASSGVDLEDTWRRSWQHMLNNGYAYIGITSKSLTADALKKFDPQRYGEINWKVDGKNEDGLFWDMLSQLGFQLRQAGTGGILGKLQPKYVYLGGQSQSGFYMNTYITAFTDRLEVAGPGGKPLFDGYLNLVGPGAMPLRTEDGIPSVSVPKTLYKATSVPQMVIMSEAEHAFYNVMGNGSTTFPAIPPYSRRADSDSASDKFRFYEIPGAPHADPTSPIIPVDSEIMKAKADGTGRPPKVYVAPHVETELNIDEFVTGALENMHAWAANKISAPSGNTHWMWYSTNIDGKGNLRYSPLRDNLGNALGGLRSPLIDAPLYRFYAFRNDSAFDTDGSMVKLSDATINGLYGGSCSTYLARFNAAADALLTGRYIVKTDADKLKAWGEVKAGTVAWNTPCN